MPKICGLVLDSKTKGPVNGCSWSLQARNNNDTHTG